METNYGKDVQEDVTELYQNGTLIENMHMTHRKLLRITNAADPANAEPVNPTAVRGALLRQ